MPERVVDEVPERLLEAQLIAGEAADDRMHHPEPATGLGAATLEPPRDRRWRLNLERRLVEGKPPLVARGEDEEILGEPHQAVGLLRRGVQRRLELLGRPRPPERELELRSEQRERGAELVTRIGDEPALATKPRIESREPCSFGLDGERMFV